MTEQRNALGAGLGAVTEERDRLIAEVVQLRSDLAIERRASENLVVNSLAEHGHLRTQLGEALDAIDSLTNDLALAVGHTGAPAELLAELIAREKARREHAERRIAKALAVADSGGGRGEMLQDVFESLDGQPWCECPDGTWQRQFDDVHGDPLAIDGWTYSPTEDRYEGPNDRSAYVFDDELTIEAPGPPGHSGIDLSIPMAVARALLRMSETRTHD